MKITIGENIKRMRKAKNVTQEQIAETLGVSVTAVSKWERGETYPDITLLFPLAHYFGITLDELMGYDEEKIRMEIDEAIARYNSLRAEDYFKAQDYIIKLYHDYPDDYQIMSQYMWHLAGDFADNDPAVLIANKEELLTICNRVLSGCTDEALRMNTWNMRAKILHAEGKTEEALAIYDEKFPDWYISKDQKKEQLFAKDTPEFKKQLTKNLYTLSTFATDKKMKHIWFCRSDTVAEKVEKSLALADTIHRISLMDGNGEAVFSEYEVYIWLTNYLRRFHGSDEDIRRAEERKRTVADACNAFATGNDEAKAFIRYRFGRDRI